MKVSSKLFLASASQARQRLLKEAAIPFEYIQHSCAEEFDETHPDLMYVLQTIARAKQDSIQTVPLDPVNNEYVYILTADTMGRSVNGVIHAKPSTYEQAAAYIRSLRGAGYCGTAFCLDKRMFVDGEWHVVERIEQVVVAEYEFDMPDEWISVYLQHVPSYQQLSGGISIEDFGAQFLKSFSGSYTAILGLPMYELRVALEQIGFLII